MAVAPKDILDCASELTKRTGGVEALVRTAVARSYYAAFHDCQTWHDSLPAQGQLPAEFTDRGIHVELAARLLNPDPSLSKEQKETSKLRGMALRSLHSDRVVADYKLRKTVTPHQARNALASAKQITSL